MLTYLGYLSLTHKRAYKNTLFVALYIAFFMLMFQIFIHILLLKVKNFELSYLYKKLSYVSTFR
jgi:hypothetical protein